MAIEWWLVSAVANGILVFFYALIAIEMIAAIVKGRQLLSNPLLTATAAVFVACTFGHGLHLSHATSTLLVGSVAAVQAAQAEFADPRLWVWDGFTAIVTIYFYTLRSRFAVVYRGAALNEDMAKREQQAMDLHDNVVQGLVQAKMELDLGDRKAGIASIDATLASARGIITGLLGKEGSEVALGAGDLRRKAPAGAPK